MTENYVLVFDGHLEERELEFMSWKRFLYIQYFDSRSLVLRMINFITSEPSSFNFFSLSAFVASLAKASRPRMIAFSKFFRKSFLDPK